MFTGIVETIGEIRAIDKQGENYHYAIASKISKELKIDQSVAHDGVCLTITSFDKLEHKVTAINETINKTNMGNWKLGQKVNIERCLKIGDRLDGHMVQGHIDGTIRCSSIVEEGGSWRIGFQGLNINSKLIVNKGSVCINGVSLTVAKEERDYLEVAIIPYTYENTNFRTIKPGSFVNLEFDILGKYIAKIIAKKD